MLKLSVFQLLKHKGCCLSLGLIIRQTAGLSLGLFVCETHCLTLIHWYSPHLGSFGWIPYLSVCLVCRNPRWRDPHDYLGSTSRVWQLVRKSAILLTKVVTLYYWWEHSLWFGSRKRLKLFFPRHACVYCDVRLVISDWRPDKRATVTHILPTRPLPLLPFRLLSKPLFELLILIHNLSVFLLYLLLFRNHLSHPTL